MRLGWITLGLVAVLGCRAPEEIHDVSYDDRYSAAELDLYLPDERGPQPAILLIHGGGWRGGDKRHFRNVARRFARSGWVAASANYRLVPSGRFPNASLDVACALSFLQARADDYGIDAERIAVMGYSAGGHLASLLGVTWNEPALAPDCEVGPPEFPPAAVIPGAGRHDLRDQDHLKHVREFLGGSYAAHPERYELASPILQVDEDEPPYLLVVGSADWLSDPDQLGDMRDELVRRGNHAELLTLAGGGHVFQPGTDPGELQFGTALATPEATIAIGDFLARNIGEP